VLIRQVQLLLLRFGIHSNLMSRAVKGYEDEGPYYRLYVSGYLYQRMMRDELTVLWPSTKRAQLDAILTPDRREASEGDLIPLDITRRFFWQHSHLFSTKAQGMSGLWYTQNLSRPLFTSLVEQSQDPTWIALCKGQQRYLRIDSLDRRQKEVEVFDFTMKDATRPHVIANGLVIHNCIGKKKRELMEPWEATIKAKGKESGIPDKVTEAFWATCSASADYQFCAAHATEYAYLTAATVYYKAHHPQAFYLSMLQLASDEPNPVAYMNKVIGEIRKEGIALLPPDITKSGTDFTMEPEGIRFGLSHVKGISAATMPKVTSFRREFKHKFEIFEAARAASISINVLTGLIHCGCLDSALQGGTRTKLVFEAQLYNLLTDPEKKIVDKLAVEYKQDLIALLRDLPNRKNEKGKALIRESRLDTLRRHQQPYWEQFQANSKNENLCSYMQERALLGFSYTTTLHAVFSERVHGLIQVADIKAPPPRKDGDAWPDPVKFVAFVDEVKSAISLKTGKPYCKLTVSDDSGTVRLMVFGQERLNECRSFNGRLPEKGDLVLASGNLTNDGGIFFAQSCLIQPSLIQFKRAITPKKT